MEEGLEPKPSFQGRLQGLRWRITFGAGSSAQLARPADATRGRPQPRGGRAQAALP